MDLNVDDLSYQVQFVADTGVIYNLTTLVLGLVWEEQVNELSRRLSLKLLNTLVDGQWLMGIVKLGGHINVFSDWGEGQTAVFWGQIWQWDYSSSEKKELSVEAYDCLKYLQQSYDYGYFTAGQSTASIIYQICQNWGVKFAYNWECAMIHEKKVFSNQAVSEMILELLEEVKGNSGQSYVCHYKDNALTVNPLGQNVSTYVFSEYVTFSTDHKLDLMSLVSRVKVIGNADDEGRSLVEAVVDGDQSFGVLQKILVRDSDKCICDAKAQAENYLKEYGSPSETISVVAVDVPFLRKGDVVAVSAGDLLGEFYILGVSHDGMEKKMSLRLEKKG